MPAVPTVPNLKPFIVYRFGLSHWKLLLKFGARQGWPGTTLGISTPLPMPIPDGSFTFDRPPMTGVREEPLEMLTIEPSCHEPNVSRTNRCMFPKVGVL